MTLPALVGALLIGLSLGLLGSGGSILTVPVLVYLLGEPPKQAIAESLLIVGGIALLGAVPYALRGLVDFRNVLFFGLPGMAGTYLGAWLSRFVSGQVQLLPCWCNQVPMTWEALNNRLPNLACRSKEKYFHRAP